MKKFLVFAVILALLLPAAAFAAAEFSLGGFIKLDSFWDSQNGQKHQRGSARNNARRQPWPDEVHGPGLPVQLHHQGTQALGRRPPASSKWTSTRAERPIGGNASASNSYMPRLRHAMFRFNWPTTELLFGQYWSMFCEWYAESGGRRSLAGGRYAHRPLAQIRLTQKFLGTGPWPAWSASRTRLTLGTNSHLIVPIPTTGSRRKPRRSRPNSSTRTTSGVRPPITASPFLLPPSHGWLAAECAAAAELHCEHLGE